MDARRNAFDKWWYAEDNLVSDDMFMCDTIKVWDTAWDAAMKEAMTPKPIMTAPRDGTAVLAHVPDMETSWFAAIWLPSEKTWFSTFGYCKPTHWIPMPARPE